MIVFYKIIGFETLKTSDEAPREREPRYPSREEMTQYFLEDLQATIEALEEGIFTRSTSVWMPVR